MIYALHYGQIISIADVESGLKCDCICPSCGAQLVARKGSKVMHHFAHQTTQNCSYGYQTSLHLAAKSIISKLKKITIPPVYIHFPDSYKSDILLAEAKEIVVDKVELEKRIDDIIPDIIVWSGNKYFFIEIFVTHAIDNTKLTKIKNANISTIEIDLSKTETAISEDYLEKILKENAKEKTWKYNIKANKWLNKFYESSDKYKLISRGYATHVDNCPIKKRIWRGRPYANFLDDCLYCKYCISNKYDDGMLCSGRVRIATIEDFKKPEQERLIESNSILEINKKQDIENKRCPFCDGDLVLRSSGNGSFWGCSNFPHCRFSWNGTQI